MLENMTCGNMTCGNMTCGGQVVLLATLGLILKETFAKEVRRRWCRHSGNSMLSLSSYLGLVVACVPCLISHAWLN